MDEESPSKIQGANRNPDGTFPPGVSGNPTGRPLGTKNKFTRIKEEIVGLWDDAKLHAKLKAMAEGDSKEAKDIVKIIASLMPKEDHLEVSTPEPLTIKIEKDTDEPERQHSPETDKP